MKKTGYVAVIDILGFKDMVRKKPLEELYYHYHQTFEKILAEFESEKFGLDEPLQSVFEIFFFSDTIVIATDETTKSTLCVLLNSVQLVFVHLFDSKMLARGAVAKGDLIINKKANIILGQPLIDAHLLSEQLMFAGCVCHQSIEKDVEMVLPFPNPDYKIAEKIDVQVKFGMASHFTIVYPHHLLPVSYNPMEYLQYCKKSIAAGLSCLAEMKKSVSGNTRVYYDNTERYFESLVKKFDA